MRWRYLILGVFLAGPTAAVVHVWPQRPEYVIPGDERIFIGDDVDSKRLFFYVVDPKSPLLAVIEQRDAESGRVVCETTLDCSSMPLNSKVPPECMLSADLTTVLLARKSQAAVFDLATGRQRKGTYTSAHEVFRLSSNGQWISTFGEMPNPQIVFVDTLNGSTDVAFSAPSADKWPNCCFSPDARFALIQWLPNVTPRDEHSCQVSLIDLAINSVVHKFELPKGQTLAEWRSGELRTEELDLTTWKVHTYRHPFDGRVSANGGIDPLLEKQAVVMVGMYGARDEGDSHVMHLALANFDEFMALVEKIGTWIGAPRPNAPNGRVQVIRRSTNKTVFELPTTDVLRCRAALDCKYVLMPVRSPDSLIEVYRTDPWPRWIFTTLAGGGVLAVFALLGRWRHKVMRRRTNDK